MSYLPSVRPFSIGFITFQSQYLTLNSRCLGTISKFFVILILAFKFEQLVTDFVVIGSESKYSKTRTFLIYSEVLCILYYFTELAVITLERLSSFSPKLSVIFIRTRG